MHSEKATRLRGWLRRYNAAGVLLVGGYLGMDHLWTRQRRMAVACIVVLACSTGILLRPRDTQPGRLDHIAAHPAQRRPTGDPDKDLLTAVRKNDLTAVSAALRARAHVDAADKTGATALMLAADNADEAIVRMLLQAGADPNATNIANLTAAWYAVARNRIDVVRLLLPKIANIDHPCLLGEAAVIGNNDIIRLLLSHGAKVDRVYDGDDEINMTPLIAASRHRHRSTIDLLLAHGADINSNSRFGSALSFAAEAGDLSLVRFLVARGADVNNYDGTGTALESAVEHPDVVRYLLKQGADVDRPGKWDMTPLKQAALLGNVASIKILVAHGAAIDYSLEGETDTPLMIAADNGQLQAVKALIRLGADVNQQTHHQEDDRMVTLTASKVAKKAGHAAIVRLLRQAGARE